jgi:hypothetical protein
MECYVMCVFPAEAAWMMAVMAFARIMVNHATTTEPLSRDPMQPFALFCVTFGA